MASKTKKITLKHVKQAIKDIYSGKDRHGELNSYNQETFCGTSCCIFGHANAIAGNKPFKERYKALDAYEANQRKQRTQLGKRLYMLMGSGRATINDFVKLLLEEA